MTRHQDTELVAQGATVASAKPGILHRPLPRSVTIPVAIVLGLAALLLALNFPVLHVYQKHFSEDLPEVRMPWAALVPGMGEEALRSQFPGVKLRCFAEPTAMGDRVCFAAVKKVDGYPALTLALFLRAGRLTVATVHVPWWGHSRAAEALQRQFGPGKPANAGASMALHRWQLPAGFIDMNQRRSLNVLAWSAVVWTGGRRPAP